MSTEPTNLILPPLYSPSKLRS